MKPALVSEPLADRHELGAFDCGRTELTLWLKDSSRHAQANRTARTFVWHRGDEQVVGYYSLAAHLVRREDLPSRVGRGSPEHIPAVLLARLALDRGLQGQHLAGELLLDAMTRTLTAGGVVGVRLMVVDAIDEGAAGFYLRHDFLRLGTSLRLARKMSDIEATLR